MAELLPPLHYSPYFAGLEGKSAEESGALQDRIDALPKKAKDFLFDSDIPDKLRNVIEQNQVPEQYTLALAKIIFLATLGDIAIGSIEQLLVKLGLEQRQASMTAAGLTVILGDVIAERGRAVIGRNMNEMPPLTQRVPPMSPAPDSSKAPARNIIDLRKQQPEQ